MLEAFICDVRRLAVRGRETVIVQPTGALAPAQVVAVGQAHVCALDPRDVLVPVLRAGARGYLLAHTHGRSVVPSRDDLALTRRLIAASSVVGLALRAHLIVSPSEWADCLAEATLRA